MSMQVSQSRPYAATTPRERLFKNRKPDIRPNKLGTIVRALYPVKPALCLSQLIGCTERHAQFLINGQRKINARDAVRLFADILDCDP